MKITNNLRENIWNVRKKESFAKNMPTEILDTPTDNLDLCGGRNNERWLSPSTWTSSGSSIPCARTFPSFISHEARCQFKWPQTSLPKDLLVLGCPEQYLETYMKRWAERKKYFVGRTLDFSWSKIKDHSFFNKYNWKFVLFFFRKNKIICKTKNTSKIKR